LDSSGPAGGVLTKRIAIERRRWFSITIPKAVSAGTPPVNSETVEYPQNRAAWLHGRHLIGGSLNVSQNGLEVL